MCGFRCERSHRTIYVLRADRRVDGQPINSGLAGKGIQLKGTGWLVLCLLFLGLASAGELWFIVVVGGLAFWIVRQNKRSGRADSPLKIIEELFVDKEDRNR